MTISERLIVALDVPTGSQALEIVQLLQPQVRLFKVGLQLFSAEGPALVRRLADRGCEVFLDLKLHDIPQQVAGAVSAATGLGVAMLTLHTLGGWKMLLRASEAANESSDRLGVRRPKLLGVTVLTSLDDVQLDILGFLPDVPRQVHRLACVAESSRLDGVVASAREARLLRESGFSRMLIVTPGIRPSGSLAADQARVLTPLQALQQGSDYLVVGRPVLQAADPPRAVQMILDEMSRFAASDPAQGSGLPPGDWTRV